MDLESKKQEDCKGAAASEEDDSASTEVTRCTVAVASPVRRLMSERDFIAKIGKFKNAEFNSDPEDEETSHTLLLGDYGQCASVWAVASQDQVLAQSMDSTAGFLMYEAEDKKGEHKPKESHKNYEAVLAHVPHYYIMQETKRGPNAIVRIGSDVHARHTMVPFYAFPEAQEEGRRATVAATAGTEADMNSDAAEKLIRTADADLAARFEHEVKFGECGTPKQIEERWEYHVSKL